MKEYKRVSIRTESERRFLRLCEVSYRPSIDEELPSEVVTDTETRKWDMVQRTTRTIPMELYQQSPAPFPVDGVEICAFLRRDELTSLVIVAQYRPPLDAVVLEFPAGLIDRGEDAKTAALRELKEETGYVADEKNIISVSDTLPLDPGITDSCSQLVKILLDTNNKVNLNPVQNLDEGEDISVILLPLYSKNLMEEGITPLKSLEKVVMEQQNIKRRIIVDARLYFYLDGLSDIQQFK